MQGRTNDVHQLCQRFDDEIFLGSKGTSEKFDKLLEDAYKKTREQPTAVGDGSSVTQPTP